MDLWHTLGLTAPKLPTPADHCMNLQVEVTLDEVKITGSWTLTVWEWQWVEINELTPDRSKVQSKMQFPVSRVLRGETQGTTVWLVLRYGQKLEIIAEEKKIKDLLSRIMVSNKAQNFASCNLRCFFPCKLEYGKIREELLTSYLDNMNKCCKLERYRNYFLANFEEFELINILPKTYPPEILLAKGEAGMVEKFSSLFQYERIPIASGAFTFDDSCLSKSKQRSPNAIISVWRSSQLNGTLTYKNADCISSWCNEVLALADTDKPLLVLDCRARKSLITASLQRKEIFLEKGALENIEVQMLGLPELEQISRVAAEMSNQANGEGNSLEGLVSWMEIVARYLEAACRGVAAVDSGQPIWVMCNEGMDRTAVLSALICLIKDPWLRTEKGFLALVQVEWIDCGFKFLSRQKYAETTEAGSPVFLLFLDCVYQLTCQFPRSFTFSSSFLSIIAKAWIENCFVEFAFDSNEEYVKQLRNGVGSWLSIFAFIISKSLNENLYQDQKSANIMEISQVISHNLPLPLGEIDTSTLAMKYWEEVYGPSLHPY